MLSSRHLSSRESSLICFSFLPHDTLHAKVPALGNHANQHAEQVGGCWLQVQHLPAVVWFLGIMASPCLCEFGQQVAKTGFHRYSTPSCHFTHVKHVLSTSSFASADEYGAAIRRRG